MEKKSLTLWITLSIFAVALIGVSYLDFSALNSINKGRRDLTEHNARIITITNSLRYLQAHENEQALRLVLSGDREYFDEIESTRREFLERASVLKSVDGSVETNLQVDRIIAEKERLNQRVDGALQDRIRGASIETTHEFLESHSKEFNAAIAIDLENFRNYQLARFAEARDQMDRSARSLEWLLKLSSALIFAGFFIIVALIFKLERVGRALFVKTEALAQARKEVLETVAHDLKNPLSSITMSLELAKVEPTKSISEVSELLEITERSAGTMQRLIFDLLDHAKIESGNLTLTQKPCDLGEVFDDLFQRFKLLADHKGVQLNIVQPSSPLYVECDLTRLDQLLSNLISNAIKFTPANGVVTLTLEQKEKNVIISVKDTGNGMAPAELEHVFDRYWQVRKTAMQGTGLGLSISKAIAEAHKGKLWAESEIGKGSTFFFTLPAALKSGPSPFS